MAVHPIAIKRTKMKYGDIQKELILNILQSKNTQFRLDYDLAHFL